MNGEVVYASKRARITKSLITVGNISAPIERVVGVEIRKPDPGEAAKVFSGGLVFLLLGLLLRSLDTDEGWWLACFALTGLSFVALAIAPSRLVVHTLGGPIIVDPGSIKRKELKPIKTAIELVLAPNSIDRSRAAGDT